MGAVVAGTMRPAGARRRVALVDHGGDLAELGGTWRGQDEGGGKGGFEWSGKRVGVSVWATWEK